MKGWIIVTTFSLLEKGGFHGFRQRAYNYSIFIVIFFFNIHAKRTYGVRGQHEGLKEKYRHALHITVVQFSEENLKKSPKGSEKGYDSRRTFRLLC